MNRIASIFLLGLLVCGLYATGAHATPSRGQDCASCHLSASAGSDQTVNAGAAVTLDGSGSSTLDNQDNRVDSFAWSQTGGSPTVSLSSANTSRATFTAPAVATQTTLTFRLAATDMTTTDTDTCTVTIRASGTTPTNRAPTVDAGQNKSVTSGSVVVLSGTASDPDAGDTITYAWSQSGSPSVSLSNANTASASFTAPNVSSQTVLTFQLTVRDRAGLSATDTCTVSVSPSGGGNPTNGTPPVADAGIDQAVLPGTLNTLTGFYSSDADDGIFSYSWVQIAGPAVKLSNPNASDPIFLAPSSQETLTFALTVTDSGGLTDSDTCTVIVLAGGGGGGTPTDPSVNQPPVARAGTDQNVRSGATVRLSGSGSTDPDDGIASYQWRQVSGTSVRLSGSSSANASFTAPRVSRSTGLTFELTVRDRSGQSSTDRVVVNVGTSGGDDDDEEDDD